MSAKAEERRRCNSNYGQQKQRPGSCFVGTLEAAIGTVLAAGDGRERIDIVEPTGDISTTLAF